MNFKVIAKRYGDSVVFVVVADDIKEALHSARTDAYHVFDYKAGDQGAPTVAVSPIAEE